MAKILMKVGEGANTNYKQYIIEEVADLASLDKQLGNIAFCISNKKYYLCNSSGNYVLMN